MGQNKKNKVISYDINNITLPFANDYPNVEFKNIDINTENIDIIKSAKIILLDAKHGTGLLNYYKNNDVKIIK